MTSLPRLLPVATVALAALAPAFARAEPSSKRPPNIVFILIDDMGWKDISPNGSRYYRTPHLEKLAAEGIRFTQGYAPAAVSSPSRAALLTGKAPQRLHVTDWIPGDMNSAYAPKSKDRRFDNPDWTMRLRPEETTLAEVLKTRGYATVSIGKWHLGGDDADGDGPTNHGFDVNIGGGHPGQPASYFWPYGKPKDRHRVPGLSDAGGKEGEYLTDRLTDEAIKFIDANKTKPFFIYLPHYAVHGPLGAKKVDIESFKGVPADGKQNSPLYAAMVKSVDESVGRINARIKELGLEKDTIIVFTSDNGGVTNYPGHTSNAPLRAQKGFPYEGGLRVPLIVKMPGVARPGSVSDTPVIGTDFFPTFVKLAGAPAAASALGIDGVDILPVLRGGKVARDTFVWHFPHYWGGGVITPYSAIRVGDWKLVRWYEFDAVELYNLAKDPYEKTDLASKEPSKLKELAAKLDAHLRAQGAQMPKPKKNPDPARDPATNKAHANPLFL